MILGAIKSRLDVRDLQLGKLQLPIPYPESYKTDLSWLKVLWQDGLPLCGPHAGSHLKAILDYPEAKTPLKYSPVYLWKKVKAIDNYPPEQGTDMRAIFKRLLDKGVCDYELLPTDYKTPLAELSKDNTTPEQNKNAHDRIISSYAFSNTDPDSIKRAIYLNKAVILLIDVGDTWWGQDVVIPFTRIDGGHFVTAYGYSKNLIYILDSADKEVPFKSLVDNYNIRQAGTALDLPNSYVREQVQRLAWLQELVSLYQKLIDLFKIAKSLK